MHILKAKNNIETTLFFNIIERCRIVLAKHESGQWQGQEPSMKTLIEDLHNQYLYLGFEHNNIIGGCALLPFEKDYENLLSGLWKNDHPYIVIHRFAIDPQFHGLGYGKALLLGIETTVQSMQRVNIRVDTHKANVPMHRLLISCGYQVCGTVLLKQAGERVVYQKILKEKNDVETN